MLPTADTITTAQIRMVKEYAIATDQTYLIKVARRALDERRVRIQATVAACRKLCAQHYPGAKAWSDRVGGSP